MLLSRSYRHQNNTEITLYDNRHCHSFHT
ncbi:hypothetical protein BO1005MUT1_520226 [Hyphomicrobiales bacterium]|nr:hypothetical protein BO1005MUT1_520226 [Hyphomicrobiales bacterium]